jgi:hypothetical protein
MEDEFNELAVRILLQLRRQAAQIIKTLRLLDIGQSKGDSMPAKTRIRSATTGRSQG